MNRLAIYGAGGFGKEVFGMCEMEGFEVAGYIDDYKKDISINDPDRFDDVLIAIANPSIRSSIVQGWSMKHLPFTPFVSKDVQLHKSVIVGRGSIICRGVQITVDVSFGEFVIVNLNTTIGHDVTIGNFCSLMPSVNISGSVKLGDRVFVGTGATILQGLTIGNDAIIGAGAVVTKDVPPGVTVKGVPAR